MVMLAAFELYGIGHTGALICLAAVSILMILRCRKDAHSAHAKSSLLLLTFCCFAAYPINQAAWESAGGAITLDAVIPLHLCDIAAFLCGFALITRRALLCELAYFWGLAGTLQGLLTPNLPYDFPHPVFIAFFLQHGVVVITALLLPLGLGWRPRSGAWYKSFAWLLGYAVIAFFANMALNTNFGFLMQKPSEASLIDLMPPWPFYILLMICIAGLMFYLLGLPFRKSCQK
jgi:hypothetical integral membrane protein (TIGR02206 family)